MATNHHGRPPHFVRRLKGGIFSAAAREICPLSLVLCGAADCLAQLGAQTDLATDAGVLCEPHWQLGHDRALTCSRLPHA